MAHERDPHKTQHLHNQGQPGHFIPYLTDVSTGGHGSDIKVCENLKQRHGSDITFLETNQIFS
jgi:hypothetical protein